jgi:hypothetical protein
VLGTLRVGYPGGKNGAGVYQRIINLMPPHQTYVEPFLGGGAVMRLKRPAALNIGLDLSSSAVETFKAALVATIGDAAGTVSPVPAMAAAIVDSGDGPRAGLVGSGDAHRRTSSNSSILPEGSPDLARGPGLRPTSADLPMLDPTSPVWAIRPGCGLAFLEQSSSLMASGSTLVYCDPPYLRSTRSGGRLYEFEMTDVDHRRLLRWAIAARCRVMVSGYWSGMYSRSFRAWRCVKFNAMTRGGLAEECLWCNFEDAAALHDYRYLGENFRERERIKRKTLRWKNRLARMPMLERRALLCAIAGNADFGDTAGRVSK